MSQSINRLRNQDPVDYWLKKGKANNTCWETTACKDKDGYPLVWIGGRNGKLVHLSRLVLAKKLGKEVKLLALHICDNSACVNPLHLYEGTQKQNRLDSKNRNRTAKGEANGKPRQLTKKIVREIRKLLKEGIFQKDIAFKFNIHQVTVSKIKRGLLWKWLK